MFLRFVSRLLLKAYGWKVVSNAPEHDKFVVLAAPHTSAWDFPFTIAVASLLGLEFSWLGKENLFRGWRGVFFRRMGGISIDRSRSNNYVQTLADEFAARDKLHLAIAAEGTRKYVEYWKSGFYHIAKAADVPIVPAFLDFKTKTGGLGPVIYPTSPDEVMNEVRDFYKDIQAYHPERFGPMKLRIEAAEALEEVKLVAVGKIEDAKQAAAETFEEAKLAASVKYEEAKGAAEEAKGAAAAKLGEARDAAQGAKLAASAKLEDARDAAHEAKLAATAKLEDAKSSANEALEGAKEAAEAAAGALGPKDAHA